VALAEAAPASRWRMELLERVDGLLVVNDAYNANPESMRAALAALAAIGARRRARGGRSFAVLGPMAELGADAQAEHESLGRAAAQLGITRVIAVGEAARGVQTGVELDGSHGDTASWVPDVDAAIDLLRAELRPADVVLVKASRAASLERVALAIADDSSQDASGTDGSGGTAA
jgi:UDP-N-acetylmuramoyl-tripeptide--D-alanyl-D-alanine ligase